jgi:hypothetical protein
MVLRGVVKAGRVTCTLELPVGRGAADGCADVLVRPEQIRLGVDTGADGTRARVHPVTFYGHDANVDLQLLGRETAPSLFGGVAGHQTPARKTEVSLSVEGDAFAFPRNLASSDLR